jgi:hypothetical protein
VDGSLKEGANAKNLESKRVCFVIAPIGEEHSEVRRRSDQVRAHVIAPAVSDCRYEPIRADKISEPGLITSQVIQHLLEDALVVADLSGRNANVFYELAVRHAVRKPVVQLIQAGEPIPFDVAQSRTIQVDHHDPDSVARAKEELTTQIKAVEADPSKVDTPISVAIDLQVLRQSEDPLGKSSAEIIESLQELRTMVAMVGEAIGRPRPDPRLEMALEELRMMSMEASRALEEPATPEETAQQIARAREWLARVGHSAEMIRRRTLGGPTRPR